MFGCPARLVACGWGLKSCEVFLVGHTLPCVLKSGTEDLYCVRDKKFYHSLTPCMALKKVTGVVRK